MADEKRVSVSFGAFAIEVIGYDDPFGVLSKAIEHIKTSTGAPLGEKAFGATDLENASFLAGLSQTAARLEEDTHAGTQRLVLEHREAAPAPPVVEEATADPIDAQDAAEDADKITDASQDAPADQDAVLSEEEPAVSPKAEPADATRQADSEPDDAPDQDDPVADKAAPDETDTSEEEALILSRIAAAKVNATISETTPSAADAPAEDTPLAEEAPAPEEIPVETLETPDDIDEPETVAAQAETKQDTGTSVPWPDPEALAQRKAEVVKGISSTLKRIGAQDDVQPASDTDTKAKSEEPKSDTSDDAQKADAREADAKDGDADTAKPAKPRKPLTMQMQVRPKTGAPAKKRLTDAKAAAEAKAAASAKEAETPNGEAKQTPPLRIAKTGASSGVLKPKRPVAEDEASRPPLDRSKLRERLSKFVQDDDSPDNFLFEDVSEAEDTTDDSPKAAGARRRSRFAEAAAATSPADENEPAKPPKIAEADPSLTAARTEEAVVDTPSQTEPETEPDDLLVLKSPMNRPEPAPTTPDEKSVVKAAPPVEPEPEAEPLVLSDPLALTPADIVEKSEPLTLTQPSAKAVQPADAAPAQEMETEADSAPKEADSVPEPTAAEPAPQKLAPETKSAVAAAEDEAAADGFRRLIEARNAPLPQLLEKGSRPKPKGGGPRLVAISDETQFDQSMSAEDFAEHIGAKSLHDLLEATAVHMAIVEGRQNFTRADIMIAFAEIKSAKPYSTEQQLKTFRKLLATGALTRVDEMEYSLSHETRFGYEAQLRA